LALAQEINAKKGTSFDEIPQKQQWTRALP